MVEGCDGEGGFGFEEMVKTTLSKLGAFADPVYAVCGGGPVVAALNGVNHCLQEASAGVLDVRWLGAQLLDYLVKSTGNVRAEGFVGHSLTRHPIRQYGQKWLCRSPDLRARNSKDSSGWVVAVGG